MNQKVLRNWLINKPKLYLKYKLCMEIQKFVVGEVQRLRTSSCVTRKLSADIAGHSIIYSCVKQQEVSLA